ncbi:ferredoxin, partial [Campylobacter jejuni]
CVECVGHNDQPACASACPTDGCIVWSAVESGQPSRDNIGADMRSGDTPVFA